MKAKTQFIIISSIIYAFFVAYTAAFDEETLLVSIDGEPAVYANLYARAYRNVSADENEGSPLTYERAGDLLDDVIKADVLVRKAEAAGYAEEENFINDMKVFSERTLRIALDEWSRGRVDVPEEDVRRMYELNLSKRMYSAIYGPRRDRIEEAAANLEAGEPCAEVAAEYSDDPAAAENGGKVDRPLTYTGDVFTDALYALENPGDLTDVLTDDTKTIYVILKLEEVVPAEPVEYEDVAGNYEEQIRYQKTVDLLNTELDAFLTEIGAEYNDEVYGAILTMPYEELGETYSGEAVNIVSANGAEITFDEFYVAIPMYIRMPAEASDEYKTEQPEYFKEVVDAVLRTLLRDKLRPAYAEKVGLDKTPGYKMDYYREKGNLLVTKYYEEVFVPMVFDPTEGELAAYYSEHITDYGNPERMKTAYVAAYDEDKVTGWRNLIAAGEDFGTVYEEWREYLAGLTDEEKNTRDPDDTISQGTEFYKDPEKQPTPLFRTAALDEFLREEVFKYNEGEISPVIGLDDGRYLFLLNIEHTPYSDRPYEDVADAVRFNFRNEVIGAPATDEELQEWFTELVAEHKVEIRDDVFRELYEELSAGEHEDE